MSESEQEITTDQIFELAQDLMKSDKLSLIDAMIVAERRLKPKAFDAPPEYFEVKIFVKARVAMWILSEFGGHAEHSLEKRLGAYLSKLLSRNRVGVIAHSRKSLTVSDNGAVSITRQEMHKLEAGNT